MCIKCLSPLWSTSIITELTLRVPWSMHAAWETSLTKGSAPADQFA